MKYIFRRISFVCLILISGIVINAQEKSKGNRLGNPTPVLGQPYEKYSTKDKFNREISFYISEAKGNQPLPLVVYVQGSGCASLFAERNGKTVPTSGHITIEQETEGKARLLIVEKPGVKFLEQAPEGCAKNGEFNREHTLERWAEAIEAAIKATQKLPQIHRGKVLVIGHSEGGVVACRVAREMPKVATHVAVMAGEGGSQFFSLMTLTRRGIFFDRVSENPGERVAYLLSEWKKIQAEPTSADKFFFGFAYRRWSSFLATSPLEELTSAQAKIYISQGLNDIAVDPVSADMLYAELIVRGRNPVYDRVEGADHSFNLKDKPQVNGWREQFKRIISWYLQD